MAIDLAGTVACVTGGARGIGRATAAALARHHARVFIGDLDADLAERTASELGGNVRALPLDVASDKSFQEFISAAESAGPIGLLVNNAGIMRTGLFDKQEPQSQQREIAINIGGVVTGMRLVLPGMLARNCGHIVNMASMAGKMSVPGAAVYSATKYAVVGLSRAVRAEIVGSSVTITTILPAAVDTELTAGLDTRGVPSVSPQIVAKAILDSCRHGQAEVALPSWVLPVGLLEEALPERLSAMVKRAVGAQGRVTVENPQRTSYLSRAK